MSNLSNDLAFPPIIYKYRHWDEPFHADILTNNEIFFSHPDTLNDLDDCNVPMRYDLLTKEEIAKKVEYLVRLVHPNWNDDAIAYEVKFRLNQGHLSDLNFLKQHSEESLKKFRDAIGIYCTSKTCLDPMMWGHYCKNNTGFCVGFNADKLHQDSGGTIGEVIYFDGDYVLKPSDDWSIDYIKQSRLKKRQWNYEQEIRIVKTYIPNPTIAERKIKIKSETIEELYLGCKISSENKNAIISLLNTRNDLKHIKLFQMEKPLGVLGYNILPINR